MAALLINGSYRVTGGVLGGDSVRFHPDDPQAFSSLRMGIRTNATGGARLRLAGIDALEIAYAPLGSVRLWRQPSDLAGAGADALATALGFDDVVRANGGAALSSVPVATPGHILALGGDVHGRVVGFAFPARRRGVPDLSPVPLDAAVVRASVNWMLARQGLAYPMGFALLHPEVRAELVAAVAHARRQQRGVWPHDVTHTGFRLADREQLQDDVVLLPRLFRRLADYLELEGPDGVSLSGFPAYLAARADRVVTLPEGLVSGFGSVVEVRQQEVRLTVPLERLIFLER